MNYYSNREEPACINCQQVKLDLRITYSATSCRKRKKRRTCFRSIAKISKLNPSPKSPKVKNLAKNYYSGVTSIFLYSGFISWKTVQECSEKRTFHSKNFILNGKFRIISNSVKNVIGIFLILTGYAFNIICSW